LSPEERALGHLLPAEPVSCAAKDYRDVPRSARELCLRAGAERGLYYAPTPAAVIDGDGRICDFNLAFETLFGDGTGLCRGEQIAAFSDRVSASCKSGCLPTQSEVASSHSDCALGRVGTHHDRFGSGRYGLVELRRTRILHVDPETGGVGPSTFYWEILGIDDDERFCADLHEACSHQLVWESYAYSYDRVLPRLAYYQQAVARHVAAMTEPGVRRVLDMGAGTGNVTLDLWKAQRTVTAVDLSHAMLERLRLKLPTEASLDVSVVEQNAEWLPIWRDCTFDGVTILLALYDMARPELALREAVRLLRPGGWIVVTEPRRCFELQPLLAHVERSLRSQGIYEELREDIRRVHAANTSLDPAQRTDRLWAEDVEALLRTFSFENLNVQDSHLGYCATICAQKPKLPEICPAKELAIPPGGSA